MSIKKTIVYLRLFVCRFYIINFLSQHRFLYYEINNILNYFILYNKQIYIK